MDETWKVMPAALPDQPPADPPSVALPTPGRIVMVRLPFSGQLKMSSHGQARPAIVTARAGGLQINAHVFLDGPNDTIAPHLAGEMMWLGQLDYAPPEFNAPRTWHWPVKEG